MNTRTQHLFGPFAAFLRTQADKAWYIAACTTLGISPALLPSHFISSHLRIASVYYNDTSRVYYLVLLYYIKRGRAQRAAQPLLRSSSPLYSITRPEQTRWVFSTLEYSAAVTSILTYVRVVFSKSIPWYTGYIRSIREGTSVWCTRTGLQQPGGVRKAPTALVIRLLLLS